MGTPRAWSTTAAATLFGVLTGISGAGGTPPDAGPDAAPAVLRPPSGQVLALAVHGVGVQIYECAATKDDPSLFSWTLKAPQADLQLGSGAVVGRHYGGPTWEAADGSKVVGEVSAKLDAPDGAAIPWLLLRAKSTSGAGTFSAVAWIQRLATVGGKAPATGCDPTQSGKETRVSYSAEYRFFTPRTADPSSPVGAWKTFDDKTGQARAIVRIYERNGELFGRIEQSFTPGAEHRVCAPCTDERKDQPIIGLTIIRNMKPDGKEYDGGDILDPDSGSVYRCKMHVERDGTRLILRGYIGFSLLGRTQTWERQG